MSSQTGSQLAPYIERARKVLQYEQRANHQDSIVNGGLEIFATRWANEVSTVCKNAGLDLRPIHRFIEHLEGYRRQDPMQRAASLRAALAILNELNSGNSNGQGSAIAPTSPKTPNAANTVKSDDKTGKASQITPRSELTDGKAASAAPPPPSKDSKV